jgi:hypothetical protein
MKQMFLLDAPGQHYRDRPIYFENGFTEKYKILTDWYIVDSSELFVRVKYFRYVYKISSRFFNMVRTSTIEFIEVEEWISENKFHLVEFNNCLIENIN